MNKPLSASRIKKLQECSWRFWTRYHLGLPDKTNDGALRGSICHLVFECLGNPRHKKHYKTILKHGTIYKCAPVLRLVEKFAKKNEIDDVENMTCVDHMIVEGLQFDFFGEAQGKPTESHDEIKFDVEAEDKSYRILGFIDKLFLFKKKKKVLIRDFKSSKRVFEGKDVEDNIQDMMYRLAVKHLYPDYVKQRMEFVFLKFDCSKTNVGEQTPDLEVRVREPMSEDPGVILTPDMDALEMEGFELYLAEVQKKINEFDKEDAYSDFAVDKGFIEGFGGKVMCGFANFPGKLKKDGNVMWHCPDKFPYYYFAIIDEEDNVVRTYLSKEEAEENLKEGQVIEERFYEGCPRFRYLPYSQKLLRENNQEEDNDVFL